MVENIKNYQVHNVWRTCNKIRAAASRISLNIWNSFTPLDTQKNNLISESNFLKVLSGDIGRLVGLSNQEICELAEYFRTQDGRIFYTQFCSVIHENSPELKKNFPWISGQEWEDPLQTNCLSLSEQRIVDVIISKIAAHINHRKVILRPFFQDYELISNNCGAVTLAHFTRILHFLNIDLAPEEMHLLIKKFAKDSYTVNYVAFIEAIEEAKDFLEKHGAFDKGGDLQDEFPGRVIKVKLPKLPRPEINKLRTSCVFPRQLHFLPVDTSTKRIRSVKELILRIQEHVYKNCIRVAMYFQDFDVYNVGKISEHQFERGLDLLRDSPLGKLYLATEEIEMLKSFYRDPNYLERICWRTFEDDVEQVFTTKHLQKHPNCKVFSPSEEVKNLPRKGYQEWDCSDVMTDDSKSDLKKRYEKAFNKVLHCVKERRLTLRPFFQDFDKHNIGHVTRAQVRQVFAVAAIPLTQEDILSLEFLHNSDSGFHYRDFLNKLEKLADEHSSEKKSPKSDLLTSSKKRNTEEKDVDLILAKIKAKVVCNGIKINEFMRKFDKLNERVLPKLEFDRGLNQLKCDLTCTEVKTLMEYFAVPDRPNYVDYWKFTEMAEGAVTEAFLEKTPTFTPCRHVPSGATPRSFLNFDERQILMRTLNVLSGYLNNNMEDVFRDFDKKLNTGTVSRDQLIRVLSVTKVITAINANELNVLFKCFSVGHVASEQVFHYRSFLNALHVIRANKVVL